MNVSRIRNTATGARLYIFSNSLGIWKKFIAIYELQKAN
jgi:hypothetical protein